MRTFKDLAALVADQVNLPVDLVCNVVSLYLEGLLVQAPGEPPLPRSVEAFLRMTAEELNR